MKNIWLKLLAAIGAGLIRAGIRLMIKAGKRKMVDVNTPSTLTKRWKQYVAENIRQQQKRQK